MVAVDQNDFDAGLGGHQRDAGPHHARAQNAQFLDALICDAFGTHSAFFQGFFVQEQASGSLREERVHQDVGEPARFDFQRVSKGDKRAS